MSTVPACFTCCYCLENWLKLQGGTSVAYRPSSTPGFADWGKGSLFVSLYVGLGFSFWFNCLVFSCGVIIHFPLFFCLFWYLFNLNVLFRLLLNHCIIINFLLLNWSALSLAVKYWRLLEMHWFYCLWKLGNDWLCNIVIFVLFIHFLVFTV